MTGIGAGIMEKIIVSAPGKVILHGEHSVVYGKTAVAAGLNLRTSLEFTANHLSEMLLKLPDIELSKVYHLETLKEFFKDKNTLCDGELVKELRNYCSVQEDAEPRQLAEVAFLFLFSRILVDKFVGGEFLIRSQLPVGAGLGSSAAFSVTLAATLLQLAHNQPNWIDENREAINRWAFQAERILHGTPSGIDNSISTFGQAISFKSGEITQISMPQLRVLLTDTRVPRSTRQLVAGVRARYEKYPKVMQHILDAMDALAENVQCTFSDMQQNDSGDGCYMQAKLEELIDVNQHLLNGIGVGHPALDDVCMLTSKRGWHSKLTGAGGGGCAWTLLPTDASDEDIRDLQTELQARGYRSWLTLMGAPGVTLETINKSK